MSRGSWYVRDMEPQPESRGSWYVRDRDKVTGPHTWEQLGALRRRGLLSQIHEVSQDRLNWVSASTLIDSLGMAQEAAPAAAPRWYYSTGQSSVGPVTEQALLDLLKNGKVDADSKVWRNGLSSWIALRDSELYDNETETSAPAPAPRPNSGRLNIGIASGVVGAMMAVILGLSYVLITGNRGTPKGSAQDGVKVQIYVGDQRAPVHVEKKEPDEIDHWIDRAKGASEAFRNVVEPLTGGGNDRSRAGR